MRKNHEITERLDKLLNQLREITIRISELKWTLELIDEDDLDKRLNP